MIRALLMLLLLAPMPGNDEVELLNGTKYQGKLIKETGDSIRFEVHMSGGGKAQIDFPTKNIHAITVKGKKKVLNEKKAREKKPKRTRKPRGKKGADKSAGPTRSKTEVQALIKKEGGTPPSWYSSTALNYPKSLDMNWPDKPPGPWNQNKNIGQFIWSTINENQSRWKEGIRFLHHMLGVGKNDSRILNKTMNALGTMYHNLHSDWARAAFWWQKAGNKTNVNLAHCYYKLGNKDMAVSILNNIGGNRGAFCNVSRLWSEMGEPDKGLQLATRSGGTGGNLAAGDICRAQGKYTEALAYYQKVIDSSQSQGRSKQDKQRAQASKDAIQYVEALDLRKVRSGKWKDQSVGYSGQVEVEVTVSRGRITDVKVTKHTEKQFYSSIKDTCAQIIKKQGVKGVDATATATITSEAIINATVKALAKGMGKK